MQTFEQDQMIYRMGTPCNSFYIIADGMVDATMGDLHYPLKKGDVVGIFSLTSGEHICTYTASCEATLIPYPFNTPEGLIAMMNKQEDLRKLLVGSLNRNICSILASYNENHKACMDLHKYILNIQDKYHELAGELRMNPKSLPFVDELMEFKFEEELPFWMTEFYANVRKIVHESSPNMSSNLVYGYLDRSGKDISTILSLEAQIRAATENFSSYLLNEDYLDFYDLYCDLYLRASANGDDTTAISEVIDSIVDTLTKLGLADKQFIEERTGAFKERVAARATTKKKESSDDAQIEAELSHALITILDYAQPEETTATEFKKCIEQFKAVSDRSSTDKSVDTLRRTITKLFYEIYSYAVHTAIALRDVPTVVKMFLNFGFVDATLCGMDNAVALYRIAEEFHGHKEQGIYTALEWFQAVYDGEKQPGRNEFDQDYSQYLRSLIKEGRINRDTEAKMLQDQGEKLDYELKNMFPTVNKITFGRIFGYCPILLDDNIIRTPNDILVTPAKIIDTLDKICSIDYSAFYHEMIFEDTKVGVKDTVLMDIRPDVILMPNAGSRGVMWQEIEGMNRKTPARFVVSALYVENLEKAFIRMTGEFRWEMCKREQGARWNDVSSHSLTSEYCDYAQFFAKNKDLSYDAKEKLKENLKKCKNSFKELFLYEYSIYMTYECMGSCRLNKVVRGILFNFCPMGKAHRDIVKNNTIFENCLHKHNITTGQTLHRLEGITAKYRNAGKEIPEEFVTLKELVER
ncbi:MAG: cyclic nucleotide-binding domain-containing protein [Lachnospiraceae bacterium]|nr:cyclic nucleotide-binding domain-containing protein [Lachnospiraceae bacterium]